MAIGLVALALLLPAIETARTQPFGHTYFNELVGGHQGGAALGMPRTFWGGDGRSLLSIVNEQAAPNASLFTHRMNWEDFHAYQENGLLRADIRFAADLRHADWALTFHQREYQDEEYRVWAMVGDRRPAGVVAYDGVPIVSLYRLTPEAKSHRTKLVLVVLDGFGLAPDGPGNAVGQALAARPQGFLARALRDGAYAVTRLDAAGTCVGLEAGRDGNSEAGHSNMCAGEIIEQHHTTITRLRADGELKATAELVAVMERLAKSGRPLHLIVPLADRSSSGDYADALDLIALARERGVAAIELHGLCNGRSNISCLEMADTLERAVGGKGGFATVAGVDNCFNRLGPSVEVQACVAAMRAPRVGIERTLHDILAPIARDPDRQSALAPEIVAGSKPLTDDDEVVLLTYRRDIAGGMLRILRQRPKNSDPPAALGPRVTTLTSLDSSSRYADDPRLVLALPEPPRGGLLHERLARAGYRELRIAEDDKAAHVTYFCDGDDIADSPTYARFHPASLTGDITREPCLKSRDVVARARQALKDDEADFILMNLPNADLVGHTGNVGAAVQGIECADGLLDELRDTARERGAWLVVTADHGNAEAMLVNGVARHGHSTNPVPFVVVAPPGAEPVRLKQSQPLECLGDVAWTVLDLLGLERRPEKSLLAH